jgi:hypothetical protein|tara:strand:- start:284 stop:571 length:288 start_codon:yes stop_codon:yes gene_type:complete
LEDFEQMTNAEQLSNQDALEELKRLLIDSQRWQPTHVAAERLGVTPKTLRVWADEGRLARQKVGGKVTYFDVGGFFDRLTASLDSERPVNPVRAD